MDAVSPFNEEQADEALMAMLISTIILTLKVATDVYEHSKGFFIAVGLPFAKVGEIKCFHVICSYFLAILSFF